ncbi:hypothetical protein IU466_14305 [Nocardia farcinica]|uniref:hypothetical protein n=1 Tax=Nocardia farcinica TaxID=37329 RepID=UPI000760DADB|nr:hypothetical protein [Nocardia farcinica]AXK89575.1 hypothetical protein DXT66_13700 [Nocardia farcinica]MBF6251724.1 hypothetical protein [Nocardia farcinica]
MLRGTPGNATILGVRPGVRPPAWPLPRRRAGGTVAAGGQSGATEPEQVFRVRVQPVGRLPYEATVRQPVRPADLSVMRPGDTVRCRIDTDDPARLVLYVDETTDDATTGRTRILADGRRAEATVLAATPVATDYGGRDDPVLRLDLELRAWDEPRPWRVRVIEPVPLAALELVDLGKHLRVAFFTVDRGESVAVDWAASVAED